MSKKERQLIVMAYLEEVPRYNYEVANELLVAERTYYRMKQKAMYTLGLALGVVVYEEEVKSS